MPICPVGFLGSHFPFAKGSEMKESLRIVIEVPPRDVSRDFDGFT